MDRFRLHNPAPPPNPSMFPTTPASKLAARLGVEPRQNESESFVLPLHHQAVESSAKMEPAMGFEPATACLLYKL